MSPKLDNTVKDSENLLSSDTSRTYEFSQFTVDTFQGREAKVDLKNNPLAKQYSLAFLPPSSSSKLAFAGHFAVVRFQHSADKTGGLIVDLVDGEIYELPKCSKGYSYVKNSRLLLVNPPSKDGHTNECFSCQPQYWIWNDSAKSFSILNK